MSLLERINADLKEAAKARDKIRLSAIRMIKAAVVNREKEKRDKLDDGEILQVLSSLVRKARESIEGFKKGGREDLVAKEEAQLHVTLSYMPEQISVDEITTVIDQKIADLNLGSMKDLGTLMKAVMAELKGRAEGKLINEVAKRRLSS